MYLAQFIPFSSPSSSVHLIEGNPTPTTIMQGQMIVKYRRPEGRLAGMPFPFLMSSLQGMLLSECVHEGDEILLSSAVLELDPATEFPSISIFRDPLALHVNGKRLAIPFVERLSSQLRDDRSEHIHTSTHTRARARVPYG